MKTNPAFCTPTLSKEVFDALPVSVQAYIRYLEATIQRLEARILQQDVRIHELETRLSKNSSNSSKPPSSDAFAKKSKTLRQSSGKKPGGQEGHQGTTLNRVSNPDYIETHSPAECAHCGCNLENVPTVGIETRQVFDIPQPQIEVTEHRVEIRACPCCRSCTKAKFPENVKAPVQYGERIRALVAYFDHQHFIPANRLCQLFEDVFGLSISEGTCANVEKLLFNELASFETNLKAYLVAAQLLHFDESGMRCAKKLHWVHVTSNKQATFYGIHDKRGKEALDAFGIIGSFQGRAIHDCWMPYFSFQHIAHGLCNAHHLRELAFVHEQEKEEWALSMQQHLIKAKGIVEAAGGLPLPTETIQQIEMDYAKILMEGLRHHLKPEHATQSKKPGRNLMLRLGQRMSEALAFVHDPSVPFTNNLAEQDIRMAKLRQKISGCFRNIRGGKIFCRIRSYISTCRKQSWNVVDAITDALKGNPRFLLVPTF